MRHRLLTLSLLVLAPLAFAGEEKLEKLIADCEKGGVAGHKAADEVVARFADSPELEKHMRALADGWFFDGRDVANIESGMKLLIAKTPHKNVKAAAMLQLAQWFFGIEAAGKAKRLEACDLLEKITKDFPDAPCAEEARDYAELHTRALVEKERVVAKRPKSDFAVGKKAPDFEGEDQDGKTFKLSDYRGKVVVVDFWGFW